MFRKVNIAHPYFDWPFVWGDLIMGKPTSGVQINWELSGCASESIILKFNTDKSNLDEQAPVL